MRTTTAAIAMAILVAGCTVGTSQPSEPESPASQAARSQQAGSQAAIPEASDAAEPTADAGTSLEAIAEAFRASGVEIGDVRPMTVEDYGAAPMAAEGLRFLLPSLGDDAGGRIMRYDDPEVADRAQAYYVDLGEESALLFSHVFRRENVVVQVNGTLPQAEADLLEAALDTVLPEEES